MKICIVRVFALAGYPVASIVKEKRSSNSKRKKNEDEDVLKKMVSEMVLLPNIFGSTPVWLHEASTSTRNIRAL